MAPQPFIGVALVLSAGVLATVLLVDGGSPRPPVPAEPGVAHLWIDSTGGACERKASRVRHSDGAACASFSEAYEAASQGDTVLVKAGTYRDPELGGEPKGDADADEADVTFSAASGEKVELHDIEVNVPHITFRDIDLLEAGFNYRSDVPAQRAGDITVVNSDGHSMTVSSVWNFALRDSDLGPQAHPGQRDDETQDALFIGAYPPDDGHHPKNLEIEDVTFHDVVRPFPAAHSDCLQITAGENVAVRRSAFYACADADIIPKNDQGPIRDLVIENSLLNEVVNGSEELNFYDTGRPCGDVTFRNNSVIGTIRIDGGDEATDCRLTVVGNITESLSPTRCATSQASVLAHNVWETGEQCGATNVVAADGDVGYADRSNSSGMDLRLRDGSEAIDRGDPANHPAVDHDGAGRPRGTAPDAGAFERR